jgi:ATP-binding cassette subfamily F protein 3
MLNFKKIVLRRGTKVVLSQATATIQVGEKVGLIGRNGAGKSSLFALITRQLQEDQGEWSMPDNWEISQVEQHIPETDQGATDFVLEGDLRLGRVLAELHHAELRDDGEAMALAHAALDDAGGHTARSRAQAMLLGLGFKSDELDNPVNSFSGGWRMRLQLSRALMCPADLMLLDEPTNHLDLDALVWLEDWLKRYEGTMLVISHDRDFLDAVTRVTLHLDNSQLTRYGGNYSAFETLLAQQQALQQSAFEKQQDRIAHLQKFIDRFKAKASKAKQAQSRVKALERMQRVDAVLDAADFQFEFKPPESLPNPMLSLQTADLGYTTDLGETTILRGVGISVLAGQRIGILGANGQGKSTLVKTIAGDLNLI